MFDFLKANKKLRRPSNVAVIDLGTHAAKAAVVDLTTFSPSLLGFGQEVYPENTLLSGLVSNWEDFTKTVAAALRQSSLAGGFTPLEINFSLSGEFVKSLTMELLVHRTNAGPIRDFEKAKLEKEMARLANVEVSKEIIKTTGLPAADFKIIEKNLLGLSLPQGALVESLSGVFEPDFIATFNVSFISLQSFNLLKRLARDLKKNWTLSFDQTASVISLVKKKEPQVSGVFLDFGGQVCDVAVVSRGRILGERTLPLGGRDLTQILAQSLGLSLETAESKRLESLTGRAGLSEPSELPWDFPVLEVYGQFFCESLEITMGDLLGSEVLPNWPVYYWGGASQSDWWVTSLENHLGRFPRSLLKSLVWQRLTDDSLEINFSPSIEKPNAFEPILAGVSQLLQKYAAG